MWLEHISDAGSDIETWTAGLTFDAYEGNTLVRAAVERRFEIIGEALVRIDALDPATANRITKYRKFIGLRNLLAHGYDKTDHKLLWEFAEGRLPELLRAVNALLAEAQAELADE